MQISTFCVLSFIKISWPVNATETRVLTLVGARAQKTQAILGRKGSYTIRGKTEEGNHIRVNRNSFFYVFLLLVFWKYSDTKSHIKSYYIEHFVIGVLRAEIFTILSRLVGFRWDLSNSLVSEIVSFVFFAIPPSSLITLWKLEIMWYDSGGLSSVLFVPERRNYTTNNVHTQLDRRGYHHVVSLVVRYTRWLHVKRETM